VNKAEADLIEGSEVTLSSERLSLSQRLRGIPAMFRRMSPRSILNLMCLNLASMMSTIADNIYSNWIPLFLFQSYGLKFKEMGIYSALPLLGGALGGVAGGYLNDYFIKRTGNRRWSRSLIGAFGKGVAAILLFRALVLYFDDPLAFCTMLFFVKFFADMSLATRWGTVTDIGGKATASVFAFNNAVAGIGAVLAPTMYGIVAQTTGWFNVFLIAIAAYVLCSITWLTIDCTRPLVKES
jgi:nitrate/nitrite transporter NarK